MLTARAVSTLRPATREKIVNGLHELDGGLWTVSDLAHACGVAESTMRRHLPELIRDSLVGYTSYVRYYTTGPASR